MKKIIIAFCILSVVVSLASCSYIDEAEARLFVEEYLVNLETEKFDILNQKTDFIEEDIVAEFKDLEDQTKLDFQTRIDIIEYTDFKTLHSDELYGVPSCNIAMKVNINGVDVLMEFLIIDRDGAFNVVYIYITLNGEVFSIC